MDGPNQSGRADSAPASRCRNDRPDGSPKGLPARRPDRFSRSRGVGMFFGDAGLPERFLLPCCFLVFDLRLRDTGDMADLRGEQTTVYCGGRLSPSPGQWRRIRSTTLDRVDRCGGCSTAPGEDRVGGPQQVLAQVREEYPPGGLWGSRVGDRSLRELASSATLRSVIAF